MSDGAVDLSRFPIHLGLGAAARWLPEFDGTMEWYGRYSQDVEGDGAEGRLVSLHTFSEPWDSWEVHPHGDEVVLCTSGTLTLLQEVDGGVRTTVLRAGEATINPPGVWHTADVDEPTTAVFITAGLGTLGRPR